MAAGAVGLVGARRTMPSEVARFFAGGALIHDLVLAPLVGAVAVVALRRLPPLARRATTSFLIVAAPIALFAMPLVRGYGRRPGNPSILPGNYVTGLLTTLVIATAAVGVVTLADIRKSRRTS